MTALASEVDESVDADDVSESTTLTRTQRLGFPPTVKPVKESLLVCSFVASIVTVVYKLWEARWDVPFNYSDDGISTAAYVKAIVTNGWYLSNPRLAAPFGADLRDFPVGGQNVHWFSIKLLGLVTPNYAVAGNAYFVLGFFLIALTTYFVARYLRFGVTASLVLSVVYTMLPYHAYRGFTQLTRGAYYSVPLAMLVLFWSVDYRSEYFTRNEAGERVWRRSRVLAVVIIGLVLGATDEQNAAFLVTILAVVGVITTISGRDWRPLGIVAIVGAAAMGSVVANNAPFLLARFERGPNNVAANRSFTDQDDFALRPLDLVLPAAGHRLQPLAAFAAKGDAGKIQIGETEGTALGTFGTIGFVWSIGATLAIGLGMRARTRRTRFVAQIGGYSKRLRLRRKRPKPLNARIVSPNWALTAPARRCGRRGSLRVALA